MDPKKVLAKIRSVVKSEAKKFKIITDDLQQPYEIDRRHPCVQTYLKTAKAMRCRAAIKGSEGATVITFFKKHKIPAFATGFGAHGTAHTNDEYIRVNTLVRGTMALERFIKEYDQL
jgi:acetylornithine deacetylase/succinyl-diaminopimelate desuccinylase-like protein